MFRVKWTGIFFGCPSPESCILIAGVKDSASFAGNSCVEHMIQMLHAEAVTFLERDMTNSNLK